MINATIFLRLTGVSLFTTKRVMQNGNSRDNGFVFHCLYDKREIRETMRKSEQKGETRRDRVERTSRRNECGLL